LAIGCSFLVVLAGGPLGAGPATLLVWSRLGTGSDHLDDAVRAFLALALVDTGREREAVSLALAALAPHLPRYQRSLAAYARLLLDGEPR
jgi:Tetratrico peptide repeat